MIAAVVAVVLFAVLGFVILFYPRERRRKKEPIKLDKINAVSWREREQSSRQENVDYAKLREELEQLRKKERNAP